MGVPLNIDWQQILLHAFNLVILAGGLYFLLYKPVTAFMEKRQAYYAGLEADAQEKLRAAEQKEQEADERLSGMQKSRSFSTLPERRLPVKRMPCCARPTKSSVRSSPTPSTSWSPIRTIRMRTFCTRSSGAHNT